MKLHLHPHRLCENGVIYRIGAFQYLRRDGLENLRQPDNAAFDREEKHDSLESLSGIVIASADGCFVDAVEEGGIAFGGEVETVNDAMSDESLRRHGEREIPSQSLDCDQSCCLYRCGCTSRILHDLLGDGRSSRFYLNRLVDDTRLCFCTLVFEYPASHHWNLTAHQRPTSTSSSLHRHRSPPWAPTPPPAAPSPSPP